MSYGLKIQDPSGNVLLNGDTSRPLLVAIVPLPHIVNDGFTVMGYPGPYPLAGCSPSTHFAFTVQGYYVPVVQNGQVAYEYSFDTSLGTYDIYPDTMFIYKFA